MPIGIEDTWVDGVEAYVLVQCDDVERIANAFGTPLRWWPRDANASPDQWWLSKQATGMAPGNVRKDIAAYIVREPTLTWACVQGGASNGDPWALDDDYHRPMYEDALAACRLEHLGGPELYETPVRVAARLSRVLSTRAFAIWGSDEELALEGICLFSNGDYCWSASTFSAGEIAKAFRCYCGLDDSSLEAWDNERHDSFYLYRPGERETTVDQSLRQWADARAKELGAGVSLALSPHNMYPDDFPSQSKYVDEFMVATKS